MAQIPAPPARIETFDDALQVVEYLFLVEIPHYGYTSVPFVKESGSVWYAIAKPTKPKKHTYEVFGQGMEASSREKFTVVANATQAQRTLAERLYGSREEWNRHMEDVENGVVVPRYGLMCFSPLQKKE